MLQARRKAPPGHGRLIVAPTGCGAVAARPLPHAPLPRMGLRLRARLAIIASNRDSWQFAAELGKRRKKLEQEASSKRIFEELPVAAALRTMVTPTIISQIIVLIYNMAEIGRAHV